MAVVIVQRPDPISLTGNMKELVMQSEKPVGIILTAPGGKTLEETYYPGNGNLVHIGLREVIEADLSFTLPSSDVFIQPRLAGNYTLSYNSEAGSGEMQFTAIRGGKLNLTESAAAFLDGNFLTWQPNSKPVTYYSPEWLTYFAPSACQARLKAYWEDGTNTTIQVAQFAANSCITMNMQYAVVSGKFDGKRPMYYDVWIEDTAGTRLSYVQRYIASERQGENEQWYLFENSLGGLDSLRAYGSLQDVPEYTHHLSGRGNESEEYRVDVNRLHTRNTGYLTPDEARWLQDLFPARRKYIYTLSGLLPIVLTDSDGQSDTTDLPSSYTFTYRLADTHPYLDIQRRTDLPENLEIPIPTGETFFLPPRLAEFPKPVLSPDLLIPVEEPHTEVWGTTSIGAIHDAVLNDLIRELDGLDLNPVQGGGGGGLNVDIIKLNDLTIPSDEKVFSALRTLKEIEDATKGLIVDINGMFLRKDIDDTMHGNQTLDKNIGSTIFLDGYDGKGWMIQNNGAAWLDSAKVRSDLFIGNRLGSPTFASGFPNGWGWDLSPYKRFNAANTEETKWRLELDDLIVRGKMRVFEMAISQLLGENDNRIFAGMMKVAFYDPSTGRIYLDTDKGVLYNTFRPGDILMVQRFGGLPSAGNNYNVIKQYELRVTDVGIGSLTDGEDRLDWITFSNFVGELSDIADGDVLTRQDSVSDSTRKGIIKVTTIDEIGAPYIDVLYGIKTNPEESLKVRMGNLTGVRTKNNVDLTGIWGLYAQGAVLENSKIYLDNGMTVEQNFSVMNGELRSEIEALKSDMSLEQGNILRNSAFSLNTHYWTAANTIHYINVDGAYLWMDASFYVEKTKVADIYRDGSKNVLRLKNTYITQPNAIMQGEKKPGTYSFAFYVRCLRAGKLLAGIPGTDLYLEQALSPSDAYQQISKSAEWNGQGDFSLQVHDGEMLIYGVSLFEDALANAVIRLQTQITQNEEEIKLKASKEYVDNETGKIYVHYDSQLQVTAEQISGISTKVDNINNTINTAGWITRNDAVSLFATKTQVNGLSSSVADLSVQYDQISSAVGTNTQGIRDAKDLANKALECGVYSQEQYSQTSNPWNSWSSGTEFKHVGALWYNPSTGVTQRYTGIDGANTWETVSNSAITAASFVLQNKDKWQLVVANFDANGKPTQESGIMTTAYGNTLYAKKDGVISAINQTAEKIQIQASRINLVGATSIGNFLINNGWFTCNATAENNVGYIDMKSGSTRIAFGYDLTPAVAGGGVTCTGLITNNRSAASGGTAYALSLRAAGNAANDSHAVAIDCEGGARIRGEFSLIENLFTNANSGISNSSCSSAANLRSRRTFVFAPSVYTSIYLPSDTAISNEFGYFTDGRAVVDHSVIVIKILVAYYATEQINVQSTINIIDHNGNTIRENNSVSRSNFNMGKGDYAELMYLNRRWYLVNRSF